MNKTLRGFLFWTPHALGILIAGLLTLLSTDVFAAGYPFWQSIPGFLIHMLPTFAVILVLVLGRNCPRKHAHITLSQLGGRQILCFGEKSGCEAPEHDGRYNLHQYEAQFF